MRIPTPQALLVPSANKPAAADAATKRGWPWKKAWLITACVVAVFVAGGIVMALKWPFTRAAFTRSLEQDSQGRVEIGSFRQTFFPHPGCVAEQVVLERDSQSPRLTIKRLTVVGSYLGLLDRYIPRVTADGAILSIPPGGLKELFANRVPGQHPTNTKVGEIVADSAQILVVTEQSEHPLAFNFRSLKLHSVSSSSAVQFDAALLIPILPGDLQIRGSIGPFQRGNAGQTQLTGSYTFKNGRLDQLTGVGGELSSKGKFKGQLSAIDVDGETTTPDFQLDIGVHPVALKTTFHALVNGTTGDLQLDPVDASWGETKIVSQGKIEALSAKKQNKTIVLDMVCSSGTVQDLLRLFVHDDKPPMTGDIKFHAEVSVPPGEQNFLKKISLEGNFAITDGQYASPATQKEVDTLSADAQGQADKIEDDEDRDRRNGTSTVNRDLQRTTSDVKGQVSLRHGVATFSELTFDIPGASALLHGTYDLQTLKIDMRGPVHMQSKLPGATTGWKSFLLKIVQPFRHHNDKKGSTVFVHVTGTYGHPLFTAEPAAGAK